MPEAPRGLAPFDEPVYLEHTPEPATPEPAPADGTGRPVVAFIARSSIVVALATVAPFLTDDEIRPALAVGVAVHLMTTTALDVVRSRARQVQAYSLLLVLLDAGFLALVGWLTTSATLLLTVGLLLVAFHRWSYGRWAGALSIVSTMATISVLAALDRTEGTWVEVVSLALVGSLLLWLVDDQAIRHRRTSEGLHLMSSRAEAVLQGIGDAIVSTDATGRILEINRAAGTLLGCRPDDASGGSCQTTLGLHTEPGLLTCDDGCALLAADGAAVEVRRTGPQGNRQPLLASAVALRDPDGEVLEVVHLLRDITSVKQADEAKTLFLATASHELKTPLSVIHGYAQLLRMADVGEAEREHALDSIDARTHQLVDIVDRLLMSSRIEAGRIDLQPRLIDPSDIIAERATAFADAHPAMEMFLDVDGELPMALADEAALATVLDHLLENAEKYSPEPSAVDLRAHHDEDAVVISLRDRGIGMSGEQIERCFERFWQAEGTDVRRFGGTGIGLYIVRSLVDAMGGEVSAAPNDDVGTTFTVRLRRTPPHEHDGDPASPDDRQAPSPDGEESMIREFMRQVGVLPEAVER